MDTDDTYYTSEYVSEGVVCWVDCHVLYWLTTLKGRAGHDGRSGVGQGPVTAGPVPRVREAGVRRVPYLE